MEQIIMLALSAVSALLPVVGEIAPSSFSATITFIEGLIPQVAQLGPGIITSIQNIVSLLGNNTALTPDQITAIGATSDALEAALDAAAKADGLTGAPTT